MMLYKNTFRIESTRLKGYDYSQPGEYFITICTHHHECVFGMLVEEEMRLSQIGVIAKRCWEKIPDHFHHVELDEFVVMPNHLHGIVILKDQPSRDVPLSNRNINPNSRDVQLNVSTTTISPKRGTLSVVIRTYKAAVTRECRFNNLYEFRWQPRFYEHIIRDDKELQNIRDYITNNPIKWYYDDNKSD